MKDLEKIFHLMNPDDKILTAMRHEWERLKQHAEVREKRNDYAGATIYFIMCNSIANICFEATSVSTSTELDAEEALLDR